MQRQEEKKAIYSLKEQAWDWPPSHSPPEESNLANALVLVSDLRILPTNKILLFNHLALIAL